MSSSFKLSDIIFAVVVPVVVALVIIAWPTALSSALLNIDPSYALNAIFVDGFFEAVLLVGVPMFFGLLWNQWAGGSSGFLLGSLYALYWSVQYQGFGYAPNDISLLGYVVGAMLTGYIAGALNKGSTSFRRMLVAGVTAGIIGGLLQFLAAYISPIGMVTDIPYVMFITLLPRIIYGIIIPFIAMVFTWYGITPKRIS
jgi:hypothetical protein